MQFSVSANRTSGGNRSLMSRHQRIAITFQIAITGQRQA
jgi:hypothetical protein